MMTFKVMQTHSCTLEELGLAEKEAGIELQEGFASAYPIFPDDLDYVEVKKSTFWCIDAEEL